MMEITSSIKIVFLCLFSVFFCFKVIFHPKNNNYLSELALSQIKHDFIAFIISAFVLFLIALLPFPDTFLIINKLRLVLSSIGRHWQTLIYNLEHEGFLAFESIFTPYSPHNQGILAVGVFTSNSAHMNYKITRDILKEQ